MEQNNKSNRKNNNMILNHPISKIIIGIIVCIIIPLLLMMFAIKPLFGFLDLPEDTLKLIRAPFSILVILFTYKIFFKYFDKRIVTELSFKYLVKDSIIGLLTGFILISLVTATLYLFGYYEPHSTGYFSILINAFMLFTIAGILEEIIFRGIIYRITEDSLGTVWALIISSLIFGFLHMANTNFNLLSGFAIALELGLLTGIFFTLTKRLWLPIALHIGWNFSFIFWGTTVTGATEFPNFIDSTLVGPELITGGVFGPENSVITILFSLILFLVIFFQASKRGQIIKRKSQKRFPKQTG
ncbi:lysostaphin resistance A-like protein [Candidatus Neomarinimicrobiota bacterium]